MKKKIRYTDEPMGKIRTISKARIGKKIASLRDKEIAALQRLITEMYGEG